MEAPRFSETFVTMYQSTRGHILEDGNIFQNIHESLKCYERVLFIMRWCVNWGNEFNFSVQVDCMTMNAEALRSFEYKATVY